MRFGRIRTSSCSPIVFFLFCCLTFLQLMSLQQEVSAIIAGVANPSANDDKASVERALLEVGNLLRATQDSMLAIYADVEAAATKDALKEAFGRLNGIWGMFISLHVAPENSDLVSVAISSLGISERMATFLDAATSIKNALLAYKSAIVTEVAGTIRMREDHRRAAGIMDDELLSKLLPDPPSTSSDAERILEAHSSPMSAAGLELSSMKRGFSYINPMTVIPKK